MVLPVKTTIAGVALLAALATGWIARGHLADADISKLQLEYAETKNQNYKQIASYQEKLSAELKKHDELNALLKKQQAENNRVIEKEVIRYVEKNANANSCLLPVRWVQLHNDAATTSMPDADASSRVDVTTATIGAALETVTSNYISCNETRQKLIELQQFVRTIHEQARP